MAGPEGIDQEPDQTQQEGLQVSPDFLAPLDDHVVAEEWSKLPPDVAAAAATEIVREGLDGDSYTRGYLRAMQGSTSSPEDITAVDEMRLKVDAVFEGKSSV